MASNNATVVVVVVVLAVTVAVMAVWALVAVAADADADSQDETCSSSGSDGVLMMDCVGSAKGMPSDKCCAQLRKFAQGKCFCAQLRSVDVATLTSLSQACGIALRTDDCTRRSRRPPT